ncbi:MAG: hypothetical protein WA655_13990 [Candidatus Korobacteraceae bacterium]
MTRLRDLADAALRRAGSGPLLESDCSPNFDILYTETHLALLLYLLYRLDGGDPQRLKQSASRLELWNNRGIAPIFFNALAVSLLGVLVKQDESASELQDSIAPILQRRSDAAEMAWNSSSGNNMYLQQLCVDLVLAPLALGRNVKTELVDQLATTFSSCMSDEGFFFDLPRPNLSGPRQFPFTYILKFLFLQALCHKLTSAPSLERLFRQGFSAILPFIASDGGFSYSGRTDNTIFAAGLATFCLRAAISFGIELQTTVALSRKAPELFLGFPVSIDGCMEANRYPLPASTEDLLRSRDAYAYRWQYAIAGSAYCLLAELLFPAPPSSTVASEDDKGKTDQQPVIAVSRDLGLIRVRRAPQQDLFVRTMSNIPAQDRRQLGPTILRLENRGALLIGAIPMTIATDADAVIPWQNRSALGRHRDLLAYRWQQGFEFLHAELVGFLPVILKGRRVYLPLSADEPLLEKETLVTEHTFVGQPRSGYEPAMLHFTGIVRQNIPSALRFLFGRSTMRQTPNDIRLVRTLSWSDNRIHIADRITGSLDRATVIIGSRMLSPYRLKVNGLAPGKKTKGWSSDGPATIQLYETHCSGPECRYELTIQDSSSLESSK